MTKAIQTKLLTTYAPDNRTNWFKRVSAVDSSKNNGYAFGGDFLEPDVLVELAVGTIIVEKEPYEKVRRSGWADYVKGNNVWKAYVYRVVGSKADDQNFAYLEHIASFDWQKDFSALRDFVKRELVHAS